MRLVLLIAVIASAFLAWLLPQDLLVHGVPAGAIVARAAFVLVAVALTVSLAQRYRGRFGAVLRDALLWVGIFAILVTTYTYRDLVEPIRARVMAELVPGTVVSTAPGVAMVVQRRDGHFVLDAQVNGTRTSFLFDTGATDVVLKDEDARRMGLDMAQLQFDTPVSTANGMVRAAPVTLDSITIGSITVRKVRALVGKPGALSENLLGQSFLEKLAGYGVENQRLILRGR